MIPAPPGLVALYQHGTPPHYAAKTIIAFDDDGYPLVISDEKDRTRLVRADLWDNYAGIADDPEPLVTAMMPAGGWRVECTEDDGSTWSQPLAAWGLSGGVVVPLFTDSEGFVQGADRYRDTKWRIYHPEADPDGD